MNPQVLSVYESPFPKVRLGKDFDGGYVIIDVPNVKYDTILSCGIKDDISFEEDFLKKYSETKCIAFDGTIENLPKENNDIEFIKKNIGIHNDEKVTDLKDIMNSNKNIFLKMDIEGTERPWVKSLNYDQINKLEQAVIEFHWPFSWDDIEIFDKLNDCHYLVHIHANNYCGMRNHGGINIPNVFECTYLNKKHFSSVPNLNKEKLPSSIDMKNVENMPQLCPPVSQKFKFKKSIRRFFTIIQISLAYVE